MSCAKNSQLVFDQISSILAQITDEDYQMPLELLGGSTMGKHFRHILDFYKCIVVSDSVDQLDYSTRDRSPTIENSTEHARASYLRLHKEIDQLDENHQLTVISDFHNNDDTHRPHVQSTIGRELMYAYDHAIHHLAIIKIGIKAVFPYIAIDQSLGIAPSTIKFNHHTAINH